MKRVRITLEADAEFISQLDMNVGLGGLAEKDELTAGQVLALMCRYEFRGAHAEEVHAAIPPTWRPHIHVISEERSVTDG